MAPVTVWHYVPKSDSRHASCGVPVGLGARRYTADRTRVTCAKCRKRSKRLREQPAPFRGAVVQLALWR